MLLLTDVQSDKCDEVCNPTPDDQCCLHDCYYETLGFFDGQKIDDVKTANLFDFVNENIPVSEDWRKVIKKSIETCHELGKTFFEL